MNSNNLPRKGRFSQGHSIWHRAERPPDADASGREDGSREVRHEGHADFRGKATHKGLPLNSKMKMDGLAMLQRLDECSVPLVFFDPQYRSVLDRQRYGNERTGRNKSRMLLPQMGTDTITLFMAEIWRVLSQSGYLMMWIDKYMLCEELPNIKNSTRLQIVDLITWDKTRMGMGYRSRRRSEYLVIFQKKPVKAKGTWRLHDIPDVWSERISNRSHTHAKPVGLQSRLIEAATMPGDIVVDPCAGGFSVLESARKAGRHFLGCDLLGCK